MSELSLKNSPLGKNCSYLGTYAPSLLFPIPRKINREKINVYNTLPFRGMDIWNAYEISWLNLKGKPEVALGEFWIPCDSECIVESKSIKLYLNSFNQTKFPSMKEVQETIQKDLSSYAKADVKVALSHPKDWQSLQIGTFPGYCLDDLDPAITKYDLHPDYLVAGKEVAEETVYSNLLKSNCQVTEQPDWASLTISYKGPKIDHEGLLKYIVSFRGHNEFHEPCIERIFVEILRRCKPEKLTVFGRFTRRGGLDINPYRSTHDGTISNIRLARQ